MDTRDLTYEGCKFPPGGAYLVHLSEGDEQFFRVTFSSVLSSAGYQNKTVK